MSEIIYLKDILPAKADTKKEKKITRRPRLKPFKYEKILQSFLIEKEKKEDYK